MFLRFCPKIPTTKGSKSGFEMTHGHVSTSPNTSLSFATPPPSQKMLFSKKQRQKNIDLEWEPLLNQQEEQWKPHA